jgi:uncharacterized protein YoxC
MKEERLLLEGIYAMIEETREKQEKSIKEENKRLARLETMVSVIEQKCDKLLQNPVITLEDVAMVGAEVLNRQKSDFDEIKKLAQGLYIYIDNKVKPLIEKSLAILEENQSKPQKKWYQRLID